MSESFQNKNTTPQHFLMRRFAALLLVLLLPLASASWAVHIQPSVQRVLVYGYADSPGCLVVGSGEIVRADVLVGAEVVPADVNDYLCLPGDTAFQLVLRGYPLSFTVPEANVSGGSVLYPVYVSSIGSYTSVVVDARPWLLPLALGVLILAAAVALGVAIYVRRRQLPDTHGYSPPESEILRYIASHPGCTQKEIASALGLEKYQVSRILSRLEAEGAIVRIKKGISKRVFLPAQLRD